MHGTLRVALRLGVVCWLIHSVPLSAADAATNLQSRDFDIELDRQSQTLISLKPKQAGGFDFAPSKLRRVRTGDGYYHLGDLDLRLRLAGEAQWRDYSTAYRRQPAAE
ncbi:MAG: DUF5695 domain-containing protein, partial [Steroidobacter sp.]